MRAVKVYLNRIDAEPEDVTELLILVDPNTNRDSVQLDLATQMQLGVFSFKSLHNGEEVYAVLNASEFRAVYVGNFVEV